ncbi:amino acid permease [Burkholderia ubonensis]|uniref:amino acid permease n=1 Tax=Burkholderia ubonensis TaxID=101571 RepID=UPI00075DB326|nr:amino acid permease [Burkholderia ubonensis]KVG23662.1 aromatic amino acid transporter [Burkholderia ubonensis]OJA66966.1 aromatic amino acid transporter AroP [Burkholderia ubonensis]
MSIKRKDEAATLQRSLGNRHIQLIALGGTLGTGLFLGSAGVIEMAGPSMLLGYALCGLFAFTIMRLLGEMVVAEPVSGSFSHFASKYWGRFPGFLAGWNCVILYVLLGMLELTAAGKFVQFWWPDIPTWITAAFFFTLLNTLNLASVRLYGETEFWFALVKVVAVVGMIILGGYLMLSGKAGPQASVANLWNGPGFLAHGTTGLAIAMPVIAFSFGGLEMLSFTAAEADQPARVIPKAINQVPLRVLIFYVGSVAIVLMLTPQQDLVAALRGSGDIYSRSPFVEIFAKVGVGSAATLLNFIILTAALSVYNSMVYCTSRLLHGMAAQGDAPRSLGKVNQRGVPVRAILFPAALTGLCVLLNYVIPKGLLEALMSLIVAALLILWTIIIVVHLKFRRQTTSTAIAFKAPLSPLSNLLCFAFVIFVAVVMFLDPSSKGAVVAIPIWLGIVFLAFVVHKSMKRRAQVQPQMLESNKL